MYHHQPTAPSFDDGEQPHNQPPTLSWQAMFQQLKDYQDLGHRKGPPPRIARWMAAQRRQYRIYGVGKKTPVGIIKQRIKKLNSVGFSWDAPANEDDIKKIEQAKKKSKIKHNLLTTAGAGKTRDGDGFIGTRTSDLSVEREVTTKVVMHTTQSSRGRIRMPSRRMQESHDKNLQADSMEEADTLVAQKEEDDDVSTAASVEDTTDAKPTKFPGRLLVMVNDMDQNNPSVLEWLEDGTGFRLNDEDALVKEMKNYFTRKY